MSDLDELGRLAQPLFEHPPIRPTPLRVLRERVTRRRRRRRATASSEEQGEESEVPREHRG